MVFLRNLYMWNSWKKKAALYIRIIHPVYNKHPSHNASWRRRRRVLLLPLLWCEYKNIIAVVLFSTKIRFDDLTIIYFTSFFSFSFINSSSWIRKKERIRKMCYYMYNCGNGCVNHLKKGAGSVLLSFFPRLFIQFSNSSQWCVVNILNKISYTYNSANNKNKKNEVYTTKHLEGYM